VSDGELPADTPSLIPAGSPFPIDPAIAVAPAVSPSAPPAGAAPPRVGESIGGAFDLAIGASRQIRSASIYFGLVALALVGPGLVLFLAMLRRGGGLPGIVDGSYEIFLALGSAPPTAETMLRLAVFCAIVGAFAVFLEGQIVVTAILGAVAGGRRVSLRDTLQLSREVFWPVLGGSILVGIVGRVADWIVEALLRPTTVSAAQGVAVVQFIATAIVTAPFAFWLAGIVIGGVGPVETLKRSVRIAVARWRLAILVAATGTVLSIIELFGFLAGADLIVRLFGVLGLDIGGTPTNAIVTSLILLAGLVAMSSLLITIAALVAAPQVYVFIRMTGYTDGLNRARRDPRPGEPPTRLITRSMLGLIAFAVVVSVAGLTTL
jgi:hypothetical protein